MQQVNDHFEYLVASRFDHQKKDPHIYEGKYGEVIELWIFPTEQYYINKRLLMEAESSDFVILISSMLCKSVLDWYRAFIAGCEGVNAHKHEPVAPKNFEYDLRERIYHLKQKETIHEYGYKFQDLLSQTELMDFEKNREEDQGRKSWYATRGYINRLPLWVCTFLWKYSRTPSKPLNGLFRPKQQSAKRFAMKGKNWTKPAKCNNCGETRHFSPQCKKPKNNESKRCMSGLVITILEVEAEAYKNEVQQTNVSIFVDKGSSLNSVTEELVKKLELEVT
ncbi:hypothetical protein PHMEG_00019606 [Phytophthora megakarya]|uniref:CCHC-type domain-containing protein n=1 Tax=Phytophthora megakarya TaxID=4795 RepID=A0A225VR23_9STRA|nr:hypothetical protein PHMEG_00019606 [Phytophthora megakarya]